MGLHYEGPNYVTSDHSRDRPVEAKWKSDRRPKSVVRGYEITGFPDYIQIVDFFVMVNIENRHTGEGTFTWTIWDGVELSSDIINDILPMEIGEVILTSISAGLIYVLENVEFCYSPPRLTGGLWDGVELSVGVTIESKFGAMAYGEKEDPDET